MSHGLVSETAEGTAGDVSSMTLVDRLGAVLHEEVQLTLALTELVRAKRDAIRQADIDTIVALSADEQRQLRRLAEVDGRRRAAAMLLTTSLEADAREPLGLRLLARRIGGTRGTALEKIGDTLRQSSRELRRESAIVARASDRLMQHVNGLLQTVQAAVSSSGTYGRAGRPAAGSSTALGIDAAG